MTTGIKKFLAVSGVSDLINRMTANKVNIMLYHGVRPAGPPSPGDSKFLPADVFEAHIRTYSRYGTPVPLESLLDGARLPENSIVLTFDDGYANNYEVAFPILRKYSFPAAFFLTTGFLDRETTLWTDRLEHLLQAPGAIDRILGWEGVPAGVPRFPERPALVQLAGELKRELKRMRRRQVEEFLSRLGERLGERPDGHDVPASLRPLTWDQVREMRASGLASFGAHTVSHPILSQCSAREQQDELVNSKRRLEEELGEECQAFAYPNGTRADFTFETRRLVQEAGYKLAATAEPGYNHRSATDPYELKRWGPDFHPADLGFVVCGGVKLTQRKADARLGRQPCVAT